MEAAFKVLSCLTALGALPEDEALRIFVIIVINIIMIIIMGKGYEKEGLEGRRCNVSTTSVKLTLSKSVGAATSVPPRQNRR